MNVGIIVHSHTGNTLSVAQNLKQTLSSAGHAVSIERVSALNDEEADVQKIKLNEIPDVGLYDVLLFGAPVRGFSLSPVMQAYLAGIQSLGGKKTACFVTQFFPFAWMGGQRALRQMCDICKNKGASLYGTGIVNWSRAKAREKQIEAMAGKLCVFN
ncbi:MAG: flavodoxin family protein [Christensenellaceae bacterium]|nr:flavodoxin family protein [Christensenellaceae bacterium]